MLNTDYQDKQCQKSGLCGSLHNPKTYITLGLVVPTVRYLQCCLVLNRLKDAITQHRKLNLHKMITVIVSFSTLPLVANGISNTVN